MPTTLTLKNIPDDVYERLKAAAEVNRRSLNSEIIVCLETVLMPIRISSKERLERARQLRAGLNPEKFQACNIDIMKKQGRPNIMEKSNALIKLTKWNFTNYLPIKMILI